MGRFRRLTLRSDRRSRLTMRCGHASATTWGLGRCRRLASFDLRGAMGVRTAAHQPVPSI